MTEKETLAERLQDAARQTRPEFSEALHRRVWEAVNRRQAAESPRPARARPARPARWTLAAAGVAGLLITAAAAWHGLPLLRRDVAFVKITARQDAAASAHQRPQRRGIGLFLVTDSAPAGAAEIDRLANVMLLSQGWAGLHHDARLAMNALAENLPLAKGRLPAALESAATN